MRTIVDRAWRLLLAAAMALIGTFAVMIFSLIVGDTDWLWVQFLLIAVQTWIIVQNARIIARRS